MVAKWNISGTRLFRYIFCPTRRLGETAAIGKGPASSICGVIDFNNGFVKQYTEPDSSLTLTFLHTEDDGWRCESASAQLPELFLQVGRTL
jgi:hypothetical protein